MANIGLHFGDAEISEDDLRNTSQVLDLWSGSISSSFSYEKTLVEVQTWSDPTESIVGIEIKSDLLRTGELGVFYDFPYADLNKFDAPFVGVWNDTTHHTTAVDHERYRATFEHILDDSTNYLSTEWTARGKISGPLRGTHKYILSPVGSGTLRIVSSFSNSEGSNTRLPSFPSVASKSRRWWEDYWTSGAFIDLSASNNATATELQRRIILSQYLMAVNEASDYPPQGKYCKVAYQHDRMPP